MKLLTAIFLVALIISFSSCIKTVEPELRNEAPVLVVEGSISTDTVPYTVRLSYSGPLVSGIDIPDQYLEKAATVRIDDDEGNSISLTHTGNGVYTTVNTAYVGKEGRTYTVHIQLPNGKKFVSRPETIPAAVPISKLQAVFNDKFNFLVPTTLDVSVDFSDPAAAENYYKWSFYSYVMRRSSGVPCGFGCIMYEYCYQKIVDTSLRILSDASVNGSELKQVPVGRSYIYWYGDHYLDIKQESLSRAAYQFWKSYQEQITRTGSLLDPLPASIKGNVYNEDNPEEFALGYFSASGITHKRAVLLPFNITDYLLDRTARQFIPPQSGNCFLYFSNTLSYPPPPARQYPPPAGWETAERVEVHW
jgi:hypothetical protein